MTVVVDVLFDPRKALALIVVIALALGGIALSFGLLPEPGIFKGPGSVTPEQAYLERLNDRLVQNGVLQDPHDPSNMAAPPAIDPLQVELDKLLQEVEEGMFWPELRSRLQALAEEYPELEAALQEEPEPEKEYDE